MRFFIFIFGASVFFTSNIFAIESGTYRCQTPFGATDVVLKKSGRAKAGATKGFWEDYDDEALVIQKNWILEDKGNGIYTFRGTKCKKVK